MNDQPIKQGLRSALDIYLFAMRPFMVHHLRQVKGRHLGETIKDSLNGSQLSLFELSLSKGKSIEDSIDIGHFGSLIYRNWFEVFHSTFHGYENVKNLVASIKKIRNRLAHPTQQEITQDFAPADATKCLAEIADMLGRINRPNEKSWVETISEQIFSSSNSATLDFFATSSQEIQKDKIEESPRSIREAPAAYEVHEETEETASSPVESAVAYWVYEDGPTNRARIHKATCRFCDNGRGLHGSRLPDNRWIGPLESSEVALEVALDTERKDIAECKFCRPLQ